MEAAAKTTAMEAAAAAAAASAPYSLGTNMTMCTLRSSSTCLSQKTTRTGLRSENDNHQLDISNGYYLDFIPAIYGRYGIRAIDLTGEDYLGRFFPPLMRCIEVALKKQKEEELELVGIVRANYDIGYGFVYWITMDVRDKGFREIKTCICKVHYGVKGGAEDDMIVEHFKFIPSNFKYMQETSLNEQASSAFATA